MAATITKGYTFTATEWVTAAKLHTLVDSATITGIVNAEIASAAAIALSKLAAGSSAQMIVANGSGVPAYVAITGDIGITNAGAVSISSGVIVNSDVSSAAAIDYSKLDLVDCITTDDICSASAITYENLNLIDSITTDDICSASAITYEKLNLVDSITTDDICSASAITYENLNLVDSITTDDICSASAITYENLNLIDSITTDDICSASAITYENLSLADSILNADINSSADIIHTKLDFTGFDATSYVSSATSTSKGISELAIASEINTGTDDGRVVTPDALAGSVMGRKIIEIVPFERTANVETGDGKVDFIIPPVLNGMNLVYANAAVLTAGSSGATTVMIYNVTDGVDMLTAAISIASGTTGFGASGGINATGDDVATGDLLRIDIDSVSTTAAKGMLVCCEFSLP